MKIRFLPSGQEIEVDSNKSLLKLCTENKIEIRSLCKGVPSCAECRVRIVEGESFILPPTGKEKAILGSNYFLDGRRLSCQVYCFGPVTVDLTEQLERTDPKNKKIRGFRRKNEKEKPSVGESHVKKDIMMLTDEKGPAQKS